MTLRAQIRQWCCWGGLLLALAVSPSSAQNRRDRTVPRPYAQERHQERREQRPEDRQQRREERRDSRPQSSSEPTQPAPQTRPVPQPPQREFRSYQPPTQGQHSGQWLNQHRNQPIEQQKKALENDPAFRRLPRETQREYEQRLQRFNSLPPDRQQRVLRRMETWEHLTQQQKQEFLGVRQQFNSLPPDRRRVVRNAIETLRAMPPDARQRELQSGRFNQFSPQERDILNGVARLPLAPAPGESSSQAPERQNSQPNSGQKRYVPRPPR